MKVYRCLPYIDSNTILAKQPKELGINYEASNLLKKGFCSPSWEYLGYKKNPRQNINSFASNGLAKYFYLSLLDSIMWAYNSKNRYGYQNLDMNFVIWEVDLPDYLVNKYIGTGCYGPTRKIETKIPYDDLFSYLAKDIDIALLEKIKEFFNKYYSWKDAQAEELMDFKKQFPVPSLNNPDIILKRENQVYANLCFPIFMPYKIMFDENNKWIIDAYNIAIDYNNRHFKLTKQIYSDYERWHEIGNGDFNEYLIEQATAYQEENDAIKRSLVKADHQFKSR